MDQPTNQPLRVTRLQRFGTFATVILVSFLIGFVPMWLRARTRTTERDTSQHALLFAQAENMLGSAAIYARRGDYEPARQAASTFYTNLRAELGRPESAFSAAQRDLLQPLLAQRDEVITLLARSDPAAAERLAEAYLSYRRAMGTLAHTTSQ